jgi:hypothetical protein
LSRGPVKGKGTVIVILGLLKFSEGALWAPSDFLYVSVIFNGTFWAKKNRILLDAVLKFIELNI